MRERIDQGYTQDGKKYLRQLISKINEDRHRTKKELWGDGVEQLFNTFQKSSSSEQRAQLERMSRNARLHGFVDAHAFPMVYIKNVIGEDPEVLREEFEHKSVLERIRFIFFLRSELEYLESYKVKNSEDLEIQKYTEEFDREFNQTADYPVTMAELGRVQSIVKTRIQYILTFLETMKVHPLVDLVAKATRSTYFPRGYMDGDDGIVDRVYGRRRRFGDYDDTPSPNPAVARGVEVLFDESEYPQFIEGDGEVYALDEYQERLLEAGLAKDREGLELARELMRPVLREALTKEFSTDIALLSIREQAELFKYLTQASPEDAEEVFKHAKHYGIPYLQTFLIAERQPEAVKTIQEIAGGDKEKARQIFERFGEIVKDAQDNVTNILREKLQNPDSATIEMERELRNELLSRAGMFFESAAKASKSGSSSSIDAVLSRYEKETVLFASFFKTLHAEIGNDALYNVRGLSLGIERGARVTRDEREEMEKIMRLNWIKEGKEVVDQVVSEFNASLTGERGDRSYLHILKKDQKVMAFIRFEERPDLGPGAVYAGSLNVRTDVRGSALGEVLMHEAVLGEAKDHVIHAYVDAKAEVGVAYVEKLGAVLEGVDVETRGETTMHWLKLRLDFVMNKKLKTKNGRIREWIQRGVEHESLDVAKEGGRLVALMTRLKEEGKVITRVLLDKAEPSRRTFILEALPAPKETQTAV